MKHLFFAVAIIYCQGAAGATAVLPGDAKKANAAKEALEISGAVSRDASSQLSQENIENMLGVTSSDSTANFGGSATNLSVMRTANLQLICKAESTASGAGVTIKTKSCNTTATSVISASIEWCKTSNGVNCDKDPINETLLPGSPSVIETSNIQINNCQLKNGQFACDMVVLNRESDSFDGSNIEQVGKDRDNQFGNYAYDVIESYNNNNRLAEIETEVAGLQSYVNNNYDRLNETGEIDVYRNSPEDVATFGNRTGQITVDGVAGQEQQQCSAIDYSNLQSCTSNYQVTEFVCPSDSPLVCTFEREHKTEICSKQLISNCSTYKDCLVGQNGFTESSAISLIGSNRYTVTTNYPRIKFEPCSNETCLNEGYYEAEISINIKDAAAIKSFTLDSVFADDYIGVRVNSSVVFSGYRDVGGSPTGRYPTGYSGGRILFNNNSSTSYDPGKLNSTPNYNLRPYLVSGLNKISVHLGVKDKGGFRLWFTLAPYCGCNTSDSWEEVCEANNY